MLIEKDSVTDNNRIAKNTLVLYLRAIVIMIIGLYTSRVLLQILGINDVGIYNVVGGIITLFSFISSSLSNSISRYLSFSIGLNNQEQLNKIFANIKSIYICLIVVVFILGETIGLWYLYNYINIPQERFNAALWVYQCSILSTIIGLISVPYNSAIIAHERMATFAYVSMFGAVYKLLIIFILKAIPFDSLKVYAILLLLLVIIERIIYTLYCRKYFEESKVSPKINKAQMKEMLGFTSWVIGGNMAWIANTQGVNLLLNFFFGPVVNAARAIALQVQGVVSQFITNFQTAVNPQITKTYARGDYSRMHNLIVWSSKFSYFLLLVLCLPIIFERDFILGLWLVTVPEYTSVFLLLVLVSALLKTFSNPIWTAVLATGNIKRYQLYDNILQFLVLPSSYIFLKYFDFSPYIVYVMIIFYDIILIPTRLFIVLPLINFSMKDYAIRVLRPITVVTILSVLLSFLPYVFLSHSILGRIIIIACVAMITLSSICFCGLHKEERIYIKERIRNILKR